MYRDSGPCESPNVGDALDSFGWFIRDLQFDDSALQSCGHRVGSVIHAKLGKDALDVALDRILRDRELIGDQLVRISRCNQGKNLNLSFTQRVISSMSGEFRGDFRMNELSSGPNRPNRIQKILPHVAF